MKSTVSCISCDLNAFQAPPFQEERGILEWLENLPGLNYQCARRARVVFLLMKKKIKQTGAIDPIRHCFLATGELIGVNKEIRTESRDVYICWVHSSGKMYAIDADNRSEELYAAFHQGLRLYPRRWTSEKWPEVIELQSKTLPTTQVRDVIREFTTPYRLAYCGSLLTHCFQEKGACFRCLVKTATRALAKIVSEQAQMDDPIVAIPELISGPVITSVAVKMRSTNISTQSNRADVCLKSNGTQITLDVAEMMHIVDAYAVLDANLSNAPTPTSLIVSSGNATIEFFANPRMLKELALLRIWREHYLPSEFLIQSGNEDLPITITREE